MSEINKDFGYVYDETYFRKLLESASQQSMETKVAAFKEELEIFKKKEIWKSTTNKVWKQPAHIDVVQIISRNLENINNITISEVHNILLCFQDLGIPFPICYIKESKIIEGSKPSYEFPNFLGLNIVFNFVAKCNLKEYISPKKKEWFSMMMFNVDFYRIEFTNKLDETQKKIVFVSYEDFMKFVSFYGSTTKFIPR